MTDMVPDRTLMWNGLSLAVLLIGCFCHSSFAASSTCPDERLESLRGIWQAAYRSEDYDRAFVFNISICEELPADNKACKGAAVCMRSPTGDGVVKIADFNSTATLEQTKEGSSKWEYRLQYSGKCNANPKVKGNVTIEFWCGTNLGAPEVVYSAATKCVHTIVWRTWAACQKKTVEKFMAFKEKPCYVIDKDGGIIDLTPLVHTHGATMVTLHDKNYFFDLCRQIHRDENSKHIPSQCDHTALCSSSVTNKMTGTVLAKSTSALQYDTESGITYLDFYGEKNSQCADGFTMQLRFFCPKNDGEELGVSIESSSKCRLDLSWVTEHACKRDSVISSTCSIKRGEKTYDLTPLSRAFKDGFVTIPGHRKGVTYQINPCQTFRIKYPCSDVSSCQSDNGKYYSVGNDEDRVLRFVDGEFAMTFQHGTRCSSHLRRITVLRFQCNQTAGYGKPHFVREDDCVYLFDWPNNITCTGGGLKKPTPEPPPLCQATEMVGKEAVEYNLSPLTKEDGNWEVVTGKGNSAYTYIINVCHKVVTKGIAEKCNTSAASCQVAAGGKRTYNTGMFSSAPSVQDGVVTLRYEHGQKCHHAGERVTILRCVCSPGATTTSPVFEDELDNCTYTFQWRTAYACPVKAQSVEGCALVDSRTGYTFNMTGLGVKSVRAHGYNFSVAGCGEKMKSCDGAAVCRQPATKSGSEEVLGKAVGNLEMEHGDLRSIYTSPSSNCDGGKRRVVVHYRCPPDATSFEKEAEDQRVSDGVLQVDETSLKDKKACLMDVHWYTQRACVFSPDQCVLRDKKTNEVLYDISSLSVGAANASNWQADDSKAKTLFLINVCRPLLAVPGCHPHAAVCQVKPGKDEKRPRHYSAVVDANLGLAKVSTTTLKKTPSGSLQLIYTVSHKNDTCKSVINLICDHDKAVGHPTFVEKLSASPCTYVFEWHTAKACPLRSRAGDESPSGKKSVADLVPTGNCTVSDGSGFIYNMWSLHNHAKDYVIHDPRHNNIKLRLNVCSKLVRPCAGKNKNAAVCIVDGDNQRSGGAVNATVNYFDGTLHLVYDNGEKCPSSNGLTAKTIVEFTCDHASYKTKPSVSSSVAGCQYAVSWPTPLACQPTAVPCSASGGGEFYDLSPLGLPHGYWDTIVPPTHPYQYLINVCAAVDDFKLDKPGNCSNGRVSACQLEKTTTGKDKTMSKTNVFSAGMTLSSPVFIKPGVLELRLASGDQCYHHHQRVRASIIQFVCDHSQTGSPEFQTEEDCEYRFLWRTRYACPLRNLASHNCTVADPYFPSYRYDLRKLQHSGAVEFHYENKTTKSSYDFRLSVCSPLKGDHACGHNTKAAACQLSNGKVIAAAGDFNGGLMFVDGALELMYRQGGSAGKCHHKFVRSTRIRFYCDTGHGKDAKKTGPVMASETSDCQYVIDWYTPLACNPEQGAASKCTISDVKTGQVYDFSSLSLSRGSWQASVSPTVSTKSKYFLNLCALLNPGYAIKSRPCSYKSGACELAPNNNSISLGQVSQLALDNGDLVAAFTNGDKCGDSSSLSETRIHFTCRHGSQGNPRLVSAEGCKYMFEWETEAACGTKIINKPNQPTEPTVTIPATRCAVESPLTHTVFDLKPLQGKNYEFKDARGMSYKLQVCGTVSNCNTKPGNPGMCQKTTRGEEWVNAGAGNGVLSYEKNLIRLVYSNGSICHHNKQKRRTVVEFYCRRDYRDKGETGHGEPVFDNEEDCVYTVRWATDLACEKELRCSITDKKTGKVFDLTQLAKYDSNWQANTANHKGFYLINVCRALTPANSNKCPFSASSCLVNGKDAMSLGHINSGSLKQSDDGTVILTYSEGAKDDTCPKGHSTAIAFHCGQEDQGPQIVENSGCVYHFQWITPLVCTTAPRPAKVVNKKCELTDPSSGDVFDLSPLYNSKANYKVQDQGHGNRVYYLNPCGGGVVGQDHCDGADVCVGGHLQGVVGKSASRSLQYDYAERTATMDLVGGHCVAENWKATITFVCARTAGHGEPVLTFSRGCHAIFFWRTSLVCGSGPKECLLQGKSSSVIDLTALTRRTGSWHVKTDDEFFWLNLCSPIKELNAFRQHCSPLAGACWKSAHSKAAVTLGYADSAHIHRAIDGKAAVIQYVGGDVCKADKSRHYQVKIVIQCDMASGVGRPKLSSKSDCAFQFNWLSNLACSTTQKALTRQKTASCGYKNALGKFIDLSDLLSSHKEVKSGVFVKYHLGVCGNAPDSCNSAASVCKESGGQTQTLSLRGASHRYWHAGDDNAMLHLVSNKVCDVDDSKKFEVIINLQCNTEGEKEPILDYSSSHCHYIFLWQTPRVCKHLPKPISPAITIPSGGGQQNNGGNNANVNNGDSHNSHKKKAHGGAGKTVGILFLLIVILFAVVLAVVLYRSNNRLATLDRIFCFWRKRNVPTYRYRKPHLNTDEDTQLLSDGKADDSGEDDDLLAL